MQFNQTQFDAVVEAAKAKAAGHKAWVRAIERAAKYLHSNPFIHDDGDGLLILSDSGKTYHANGVCQCEAYSYGQPCWHRAAAQLVKRYHEAVRAAASPAYQAKLSAWAAGKAPVAEVYEAAIAAGLPTTAAEQDMIEWKERKRAASNTAPRRRPVVTVARHIDAGAEAERKAAVLIKPQTRGVVIDGWTV